MNTFDCICPICEADSLREILYADDFQYNGKTVHVDGLEGCECGACGADPVLKDQIKRNHQRIADAKRASDGMLTGEDIKALRRRFDLTQKDAAELFGGGVNAFSKYERGDVIQSESMDALMWLINRRPYLLDDLKLRAGIEVSVSNYMPSGSVDGADERHAMKQFQQEHVVHMAEWRDIAA